MKKAIGLAVFALMFCVTVLAQASTVTVDFSKSTPVTSVSGQLLGMAMDQPSDELITPLKFGICRDAPPERLARLGIVNHEMMAWRVSGWLPFNDFATYESKLKEYITRRDNPKHDPKMTIWEVWNEPDWTFWHGTREQFFETYKHAYKVIREVKGNDALIAGPSFAHFEKDYWQQFFDYCLVNNLEVNVVVWHEYDDNNIAIIQEHCNYIRANYMDNPKYKSLNMKEIHINEYCWKTATFLPAENLGYLYFLEKSGVKYAARGFWKNSDGTDTAFEGRLGGLVTNDHKPRAVWWLYKLYGDGVTSRVYSQSDSKYLVALGSSQSTKEDTAQILISQINTKIDRNATLNIKGLQNLPFIHKRVTIRTKRIPNTGEAYLSSPVEGNKYTVEIPDNGELIINLTELKQHWAYVFYISEY